MPDTALVLTFGVLGSLLLLAWALAEDWKDRR